MKHFNRPIVNIKLNCPIDQCTTMQGVRHALPVEAGEYLTVYFSELLVHALYSYPGTGLVCSFIAYSMPDNKIGFNLFGVDGKTIAQLVITENKQLEYFAMVTA